MISFSSFVIIGAIVFFFLWWTFMALIISYLYIRNDPMLRLASPACKEMMVKSGAALVIVIIVAKAINYIFGV